MNGAKQPIFKRYVKDIPPIMVPILPIIRKIATAIALLEENIIY